MASARHARARFERLKKREFQAGQCCMCNDLEIKREKGEGFDA